MSSPTSTPLWKLALVPILLLIFAGVLWKNFSSPTDTDVPELLKPVSFQKTQLTSSWKSGCKETAVAFNPFQILKQPPANSAELVETPPTLTSASDGSNPDSPNHKSSSAPADQLQTLSSQPVTLLIKKGKKDIAVIGDQIIHSGQRLESGHEVRSIEIDRILLSNPDDPQGEMQISPPKSNATPQN